MTTALHWLDTAARVLCCEWVDRRGRDGWCETHDDPWPCGRAQEAADVLAEELDQPTKEQKMGMDWGAALAKAENERDQLQRWKDEALPVIAGLQELGKALGTPPGSRITGPEAVDRLAALLAETRAEALEEVAEAFASSAKRVVKAKGETERTRYADEVVEVLRNRADEVRRG